ncbi:MAG: family 16 glycoside hydrolase [Bacteroidota bacterium]
MRILRSLLVLSVLVACWRCQPPAEEASAGIPSFLPLKTWSTSTLTDFQTDGTNWQIVGEVYADLYQEGNVDLVEGEGVLVNNQTEEAHSHIFTTMEHGDLELEVEFMMPKGSNSGIYFQSRYEIQLFDSWGKDSVQHADCGGIYERWDDSKPENEKGYEGYAPRVNASLAPGLWQSYRVLFRAPRFDADGNKIANARFDSVYHNGMLIHAGVEVTGPTRAAAFEDEVPLAPLMIQGDHGKVAFRNIQYKAYGSEALALSNIRYELFNSPGETLPAEFDKLAPIQTGEVEEFNVSELSEENNHFAIRYTADLTVNSPGDYLFTTYLDDGGIMYIDGQPVVNDTEEPGGQIKRGMVNLTEGNHQLILTYHQIVWRALALVEYEGPGIYRRYLGGRMPDEWQQAPPPPITVSPGEEAEMIRGFVRYQDKKRTHTIAVGDPQGIHYSYDLSEGTLLSAWKGAFADVTDMWHNRGIAQLLVPLEVSIENTAGIPVPNTSQNNFQYKGHQIEEMGRPTFLYAYEGNQIEDRLLPSPDGTSLTRSISLSESENTLSYCLAEGSDIRQLSNGLYYIDGRYYLSFDEQNEALLNLSSSKGKQTLIASLGEEGLTYQMLW